MGSTTSTSGIVRALLVECLGGLSFDPATWLAPFHWFNPRQPTRRRRHLAIEPFVRGLTHGAVSRICAGSAVTLEA
jgi:hypothetical protein